MKKQALIKVHAARQSHPLELPTREEVTRRSQEFQGAVARRAYEIFQQEGREQGRDLDHWLRAELELLCASRFAIRETSDEFHVHAEVPGFTASELGVLVEPRKLLILGKRKAREEEEKEQVIFGKHCWNQLLRVLDLPSEVEPADARAVLKNGVLDVRLPKIIKVGETKGYAEEDSEAIEMATELIGAP